MLNPNFIFNGDPDSEVFAKRQKLAETEKLQKTK